MDARGSVNGSKMEICVKKGGTKGMGEWHGKNPILGMPDVSPVYVEKIQIIMTRYETKT